MKTAKLYKYYNYRGIDEILHFVKLNGEIFDEYEIKAAHGFEIREDSNTIPYIIECKTGIIYDIGKATIHNNGSITAPTVIVDENGKLAVGLGHRTIAYVV